MPKKIITSALLAAALVEGATAFAPAQQSARVATDLNAESGRREILGDFAKVLGAGALAIGGANQADQGSELLAGLTNPAQESWRGKVRFIYMKKES